MLLIGVSGASLLYGDGVITPAISVLSATEGLSVAAPWLTPFTVPLTVLILVALFVFQRKGTESVAKLFGPVMLVWFLTLATTGLLQIIHYPEVFAAINPWHAVRFLFTNSSSSLVILGSVFLVATGAEALYADLGHFGRKPIALAWHSIVFPALLLNYLGQGALVLRDPPTRENPFFHMVPGLLLWPLIGLATLATVIASQALISGAFSLTMQAVQMGYVPFINIRHTSHEEHGQIYIPQINTLLAIGCIALVVAFRSSDALASAYGIAVTMTMIATTLLLYFAARRCGTGASFGLERSVFSPGAGRSVPGGQQHQDFSGRMAALGDWRGGFPSYDHLENRPLPPAQERRADAFAQRPHRVDYRARARVRITRKSAWYGCVPGRPHARRSDVALAQSQANRVLHERNIVLTIMTDRTPYVAKASRVTIHDLTEGFFRITAHFGFMETPTISEIIASCGINDFVIDEQKTSFFLGRETIICTGKPGMARWREHLFAAMSRHAQRPAEFFKLPVNRVIELGQNVEI